MRRWVWLLAGLFASTAMPAAAQSLDDGQSQLDAGHPARAIAIANALIDEGTRVGTDLAPIYRMLGLAHASAGDGDAAREAFTRWLALDPEGRLERSLPDDVRSPFLEARGFWASTPARLGADVSRRADDGGLDIVISDPASMVARVRARVRVAAGPWADIVRPPSASMSIDVPGLSAEEPVDCVVTFLDESGNRLWRDGTDETPLHFEPRSVARAADADAVAGRVTARSDATGFHIGAVASGAVAVGLLVTAAILHADRERLAGIYNGDGTGCTGSGTTRGEVCAPQRSAIANDEVAAGTLYGLAGAAAIVAIVLVALAPESAPDTTSVACVSGPGDLGVSCGGTF